MTPRLGRRELARAAAALVAGGAGCAREGDGVELRAAGATVPHPLYAQWIARYREIAPRVRIGYQPVGSARGLRQLALGMAELGASDVPFEGAPLPVLDLPVAVVAIGLAHHVPGLTSPLRLSARAVEGVFSGRVSRWAHPEIASDNPGAALPDLPVVAVHRSDGSGATLRVTRWLADAARRDGREAVVAPGLSARFPAGIGARGSDGVAAAVQRIPGALGYVEVAHAERAALSLAHLGRLGAGFVAPTPAAIDLASSSATLEDDGRVGAPGGYPLTCLTRAIAARDMEDAGRAGALARFLWWVLGPGQEDCGTVGLRALPRSLAAAARLRLASELKGAGRPALRVD